MFNRSGRRSGFTLPEVLVTVAIVAVLAAVVVPAVTQQISKGDAPAANASITSLRTTITGFVADVRKIPGDIEDLQTKITTGDFELSATGAAGTTFTNVYINRWNGPYSNSTGSIPVGYGWVTDSLNSGRMFDSLGYIAVELIKASADSTDAVELDAAIDDGNGPNTGLVRWKTGTAPALNPTNRIRLFLMSSAQ